MEPVRRPYRGVSAQDRRAERRARLIEAGFDVFADEGVAGTTMKAVRIRAGLGERYFYESFRDRDELLVALIDTLAQDLRDAVNAAVATSPPDLFERSRASASAIIELLTSDPRKARTYVEAARGGTFKVHRTPYYQSHAGLVADQLRDLGDLRAKRHRPLLQATALILTFGLANTVAVWLDGDLDLSREQLAAQFGRLCVAAADAIHTADRSHRTS